MPTTTNYGWTTPADTDLVKDGASAIRTLGTAIDTTVFNNASAAIAKTIVDAKGDLIVGTAADTVARLAVGGTNGHVLTVDSVEASGMKWTALPTSGGMTLISETVASALSSLSFSSISGSYKQLHLIWSGIRHSTTGSGFGIRLNNDSGSNYAIGMTGSLNTGLQNVTGLKTSITGTNYFPFGLENNFAGLGEDASGYLIIDNYASSTKAKTFYGSVNIYDNPNTSFRSSNNFTGVYNSTSAITSIDIFRSAGSATFSNTTNTTIRLYGVA